MASASVEKSRLYEDVPLAAVPFSIRLLQINNSRPEDKSKGNWSVPISLNMQTFPLDAAPPFRCLSYVWGNPELHSIFVNGQLHRITKNLLGFLRRLRAGSSRPDGWVWVDSICIDQGDAVERTQQVKEMGAIYSKADMVMAWLGWEWDRQGNGSDNGRNPLAPEVEYASEYAVDLLVLIAKQLRAYVAKGGKAWSKNFSQYALDDPAMYTMLDITAQSFKTWRALMAVLDRQWFQRAWIVQEAALAKNLVVIIGDRVVAWDDVVQTCIFLQASGWAFGMMHVIDPTGYRVPYGYQGLHFASLRAVCRLEHAPHSLGNVISLPSSVFPTLPPPTVSQAQAFDFLAQFIISTRPFAASDLRDKVFAPLAMVRQALAPYSVNLPDPNYTVLVPDYSLTTHSPFNEIPGVNFNAPPGRNKQCTIDRRTGSLTLTGCYFNSIEAMPSNTLDEMFNRDAFVPLIDFCIAHMAHYGNDRAEALWRTLIADNDSTSSPASAEAAAGFKRILELKIAIVHHGDRLKDNLEQLSDSTWAAYDNFDQLRALAPAAETAIPSTSELAAFAERWRLIMTRVLPFAEAKEVAGPSAVIALAAGRVYARRQLMVTQSGIVGLVPVSSQKGDQMWFLEGGKMGYVLRPTSGLDVRDTRKTFTFVGEAYIHGFMTGEVLAEERTFEEIVIR
ncbi:hypothetical protein B0A48_10584 [Cryoendolithus antarcticus]|uniref:Heterokaryon incompatibility domain-containing protein n=1 Tax=Cryoendolithus antarcticus TaxID=1507870 RepID=A0A1V8SYF3_9PEZI|nr:hypothetical protein B0A48_10584 [Cryoendolithus antarcticus]